MPDEDPGDDQVVIPVVQEEVHADAQPVVTGGVRVTKHVETQNEVVEQQLRTSRADVKRVKTNRVVDGPQSPQHVGNTLIIPVVSEQLHIERRWVVTEEIHITQHEEAETVQETVPVNYERAEVERLDASGDPAPVQDVPVVESVAARPEVMEEERRARSVLKRKEASTASAADKQRSSAQRRSLLTDRKSG